MSGHDGVYTINPNKVIKRKVLCDMTTDGGGWTVSGYAYFQSLFFSYFNRKKELDNVFHFIA